MIPPNLMCSFYSKNTMFKIVLKAIWDKEHEQQPHYFKPCAASKYKQYSNAAPQLVQIFTVFIPKVDFIQLAKLMQEGIYDK